MPTYIYYDPKTDEEIEVVHSMNESPVIRNPSTGNKMKQKIMGGLGIIYKGSGWTKSVVKGQGYQVDKTKDEIRGGVKKDPYAKYRDGEKL